MEENLFFVGIQEPVETRKDLLTCSKQILDTLRKYEKFKLVRQRKMETVKELQRVFDEIIVLNKKLRSTLPKIPIKETPIETPKTVIKTEKTRSKLDLLEEELAKVEQRLN